MSISRTQLLADYLRGQARRSLDRVEPNDEGRNARRALALLDAACYAESLPEDDPLVQQLEDAGRFGPLGRDPFEPDERGRRLVAEWQGAEPSELVLALSGGLVARLPLDAATE
ncbi:hypothetical protein ACIBH1_33075 [Nonomuraea sp. NPDC050663]|uniref:hypothetical protein n=1 Tax=Nonomuraea sp. NPDC050663 TaxID=3364370 RepID=UPI00379D7BCC